MMSTADDLTTTPFDSNNYTSTSYESQNDDELDRLECTYFGGDQHKCDVIIGVKRAMASISLVGSVFMIFVIWLFRKYTIFAQRLILCLAIASFFSCISYILGDLYPPGSLCNFQAWMVTFFDWVVLLWICCITFNLYQSGVKTTHTEKYEWVYHVLSWGVPFFVSFLPFIDQMYGPAGLWCWIENDWMWRFGMWYFPFFVIVILLIAAYSYIFYRVRKRVKTWEGLYDPSVERNKKILEDEVRPLAAYPFIYLAVHVFSIINRIQNAVSDDPVFVLVLLHAMSVPLSGAINALVFGCDKDTRNRLRPSQIRLALILRWHHEETLIRDYVTSQNHDDTLPQEQGDIEAGDPKSGSSHPACESVTLRNPQPTMDEIQL